MFDRSALGDLSQEPLYNTSAVARQSNVPPDTFRAWERRYNLPRPYRTPSNVRLYSERDIGVIGWLRARTSEGMTISRAVQRLRIEYPGLFRDNPSPLRVPLELDARTPSRLRELCARLTEALVDLDEFGAHRTFDEALAQFTIETVCFSVIRPTLVEFGTRVERGDIPAGFQHFASGVMMRRLTTIFSFVSAPIGRGRIVTISAPGEEHEIGLMMLSIILARRNWGVVYLGNGFPSHDLIEAIEHVDPDLVCFSATTARTAAAANQAADAIVRGINPPPAIAFERSALAPPGSPSVRAFLTAGGEHYISGSPDELDSRVAAIIDQRNAGLRAHRWSHREME